MYMREYTTQSGKGLISKSNHRTNQNLWTTTEHICHTGKVTN